jgi:hypothetical protein
VDVAPVGDGADLDAGNQLEPGGARGFARGARARGRIVIGDGDDGEVRGARAGDELRRRQRAVGGGRVKVKIDQKARR